MQHWIFNIQMQYLMESKQEAERLDLKTNREEAYKQLGDLGLNRLSGSPHIVDAGCGSGAASKVMAEIALEEYAHFHFSLLDISEERLDEAKKKLKYDPKRAIFNFVPCHLESIPLKSNSVDFLFSRFVFEYLKDPEIVFKEFIRILKPGGKLAIGDLDYNMMTHYPLDAELEHQLKEILFVLSDMKLFDPYAGRRLYYYFYTHSMKKKKIHLYAHHLFYDRMPDIDWKNWEAKFKKIIQINKKKKLPLNFDIHEFLDRFKEFMHSNERFSYTPLIFVEGEKP